MKRLFKILFVTFLLTMLPVIAQASCNIIIDGEELTCYDANGNRVEAFVHQGTTYVPVRAIAEAFDTNVSWDQATKTVHLGTAGGSPALGEEINIYFNGQPFICLDSNGNAVYPILSEGTTYLPIRGISTLFNKNIYWDQVTTTATITTPPTEDVISYLKNSVANTSGVNNLKATVSIDGVLSCNGEVFSTVSNTKEESYSPIGFTLSEYLPANYTDNVSYLGNGKYFLVVSSERFSSNPDLQKTLFDQGTPTSFSSLYIYISTKGGYITDAEIHFAGKLTYKSIVFDESFVIQAALQYPDTFTFPIMPYPDKTYGEDETPVSAAAGENQDSTVITKLIATYVEYLTTAQPNKIFALLSTEDYNSFFGHKSTAQINTEAETIRKKLSNTYKNADGSFTLDSLVYVSPVAFSSQPDNAAKATLSINLTDGNDNWADEVEIFIIKKDGSWYIDISTVTSLLY